MQRCRLLLLLLLALAPYSSSSEAPAAQPPTPTLQLPAASPQLLDNRLLRQGRTHSVHGTPERLVGKQALRGAQAGGGRVVAAGAWQRGARLGCAQTRLKISGPLNAGAPTCSTLFT